MGLFEKFKQGLKKTKENTGSALNSIFATFRHVDEDMLDELEEALIAADIGAMLACETVDEVRKQAKLNKINSREELSALMSSVLAEKMTANDGLKLTTKPSVIIVLGVNGVGKTTTIGKIGTRLTREGKKVLFAAGDTFRAAAAEQLSIWADRCGAGIVRHAEGADPSAVIFDAISAAKARGCDVVICDTAGRLHNKQNLMNELAKINRIIDRELPDACRENLLVLDATTGQNAVMQAKEFSKAANITGITLNKLDGTAKGGIVISIKQELGIPVKFIGVGEKIDDMQEFDAKEFIDALFE